MSTRYSHTRLLLGEQLFTAVADARILIVGAGGIGCELLKAMVMTGFATSGSPRSGLTVLDLDTIDLSNLNRQFLFQKQHVKRPKAVVARDTALKFNPDCKIEALHRNIKDADFSTSSFSTFDLVLNALDNLDARRHVNRMCLAAGVPLVESGTSGYVGQVQPIFQHLSARADEQAQGKGKEAQRGEDEVECFDCTGKPVPRTFAVCTIRSTPSTAQHCIAWAKSYLFPQLFGRDDEADEEKELDEAEKNGENSAEIANLRAESAAVRDLRATLSVDVEGAAKRVFEKVYTADIERLLKMEDMWAHRRPPVPLKWDHFASASDASNGNGNGAVPIVDANGDKPATAKDEARIKDQRKLSERDSWGVFVDAVTRLCRRVASDPSEPLSFDKDDDDTLDFVVGAANLRAAAFGIESQTRFQVKEYAGNIIPAIATTNAIIAAALVQQALVLLRARSAPSPAEAASALRTARTVWLKRTPQRVFDVSPLGAPNPHCAVCRAVYLPVQVAEGTTLGDLVDALVGEGEGKAVDWEAVSVQEGARLLFESEDFEDNRAKTLKELECGTGRFVVLADMDEERWPVVCCLGETLPASSTERVLVSPSALASLPRPIPLKPAPPPAPAADGTATAAADEDDDDDLAIVLEGQQATGAEAGAPGAKVTGKKRAAEEAGLDEGEGKKRKTEKKEEDDDIIVID
ncbi:hypothetical protein JCM10207_001356 [Rhodosporidiobolus poonsookiae]